MLDTYSKMSFSILGIRLKNSKNEIQLSDMDNKDGNTLIDNCVNLLDILGNNEETLNDININEEFLCVDENRTKTDHDSLNIKMEHDNISSIESEDGEYELYSKIENHMSISASLYILNRQGTDILKNIYKQKISSRIDEVPKNKDLTNIQRVYNEMEYIVNQNRVCNDIYTSLISVLDDVMFEECGELDSFFVKEDEYRLESLYYKPGSWVDELEWEEQQVFQFSNTTKFDEGECMYLLMYVNKYLNLLSKIEYEYTNTKLKSCLDKFKNKLRNIHYVVSYVLKECVEFDNIIVYKDDI